MKWLFKIFCVFTISAIARSNEIPAVRTKNLTNVFSQAFCEKKLTQETLEEVDTYAELKNDHPASLPPSFTICSTLMLKSCPDQGYPVFFTILDNERAQFLAPISVHEDPVSSLKIFYRDGASGEVIRKIPPLFPNQWTRSCMAINTTSGLIQWVVEGTLVMNITSEEVKNSKNKPTGLSKKLILGARSYGGVWKAPSQRVTNINIFSSPLSIEKMKDMTASGLCGEEGDYLGWGDMEWFLHGLARRG